MAAFKRHEYCPRGTLRDWWSDSALGEVVPLYARRMVAGGSVDRRNGRNEGETPRTWTFIGAFCLDCGRFAAGAKSVPPRGPRGRPVGRKDAKPRKARSTARAR